MNKRTKLKIFIFITLFLIISLSTISVLYIKSCLKPTREFINGEYWTSGTDYTSFVVDEGAYGKSTIDKLEEAGIIKDANIVYYWNRILGGYSFYAGYYTIPSQIDGQDITIGQLLMWLATPENAHQDTVWIKLDEGDFAKSFAQVIAEEVTLKEIPNASIEERAEYILNYWNDPQNIELYKEDYPFLTDEMINDDVKVLLEGYLFPDTYEVFEFTDCDEITRKLLDGTMSIYEDNIDAFENSDLTIHEIFTLASICQWESGSAEDSKTIAGVFLNRRDNPSFEGTGGRFQSSVTACYAFDISKDECETKGDMTEYTERENPYNTYTAVGFPPGPVCCPNRIAFEAALYPDRDHNYYFFCADYCNGGTAFATTYAQALRNQDIYMACGA